MTENYQRNRESDSHRVSLVTDFEREVITRLARIESGVARVQDDVLDHEKRLRFVEKRQWALGGMGAVVALAFAAFDVIRQTLYH
ncbi:MAG: hypothetical protein V4457_12880 [Pseudomonadota bacterium]